MSTLPGATRRLRRAIALVVLSTGVGATAIPTPVLADPAEDCRKTDNPHLAIRACNERLRIIQGLQQGVITGLIANSSLGDQATARTLNNRGNAYTQLKNYTLALADYDRAISLDAQALYFFNRGTAHGNLGNLQQAVTDFGQAISRQQNFGDAHAARALAYFRMGNHQQALPDAEQSLRLSPRDPRHYEMRGQVLAALGRVEEAVVDFRNALLLDSAMSNSQASIRRLGFDP